MRVEAEEQAAGTLARALENGRGKDATTVEVEHIVIEGRAADEILWHSRDAQLIVVGAHGKGLLRRALLGSVSRAILSDSNRPAAVVNLPDP